MYLKFLQHVLCGLEFYAETNFTMKERELIAKVVLERVCNPVYNGEPFIKHNTRERGENGHI